MFKDICELAKIRKLRTGSYHPQTNGQCKWFNKTLISMLGTLPRDAKRTWQKWVPTLVHAYNCTTSSVTGYSPYFLIYGRQPRLPIDIEYRVALPGSYMDGQNQLLCRMKPGTKACERYVSTSVAKLSSFQYLPSIG